MLKQGMRILCAGVLFVSLTNVPDVSALSLWKNKNDVKKGAVSENINTDDELLELLQYKTFLFFWNEANPETGLVKDRASNSVDDEYTMASVASVGFALPAYVIGARHGWITEKQAYERVLNTLNFFKDKMFSKMGFYYHFVDMNTGERSGATELSSIDTALFLAGVLFVRQYYKDSEIDKENVVFNLASELYDRVDWKWMLDDGKTFNMGWKPNRKDGRFLRARWKHYDESMVLYMLGIGANKNAVPADVWNNISRPVGRYGDHILIYSPPLFTHQYSHTFIDFRNKHDKNADFFENSVQATLANREFCIDNKDNFKTYSENVWGLTACDGPDGYKAYGAKPGHADHDGTVAPTAAGGSITFTPELSIKALRYMYDNYKDKIWGRYGFCDSFNFDRDWVASDVIGIDQGTILLMIENYRTGLIWDYFMRNEEIQRAMKSIGFQEGSKKVEMPPLVKGKIKQRGKNLFLDGSLDEWEGLAPFKMNKKEYIEYGDTEGVDDFKGNLFFLWDSEYLFIGVDVTDNDVAMRKGGAAIYKNDCLELFIDPDNDGFLWGNKKDMQIGICPSSGSEGKAWAWFQNTNPLPSKDVRAASVVKDGGYVIEAAIKWEFIGFKPEAGKVLRISPAMHDADPEDNSELKLNVFFQDVTGKDDLKMVAEFALLKESF